MVDKKACKVRKKKYKINAAVFTTRLLLLLLVTGVAITIYNKVPKPDLGEIVESSAYIDSDGISSMVVGVQNGAVYTTSVTPKITNGVIDTSLIKDGKEIKFKSGKKISEMGSYILILKDSTGNTDTVYFDIEY